MTTRHLSYPVALEQPAGARRAAALVLRSASRLLGRLARRLHRAERARAGDPVLEFYAQAGAPEGALYVDGKLVGLLPGVSRL